MTEASAAAAKAVLACLATSAFCARATTARPPVRCWTCTWRYAGLRHACGSARRGERGKGRTLGVERANAILTATAILAPETIVPDCALVGVALPRPVQVPACARDRRGQRRILRAESPYAWLQAPSSETLSDTARRAACFGSRLELRAAHSEAQCTESWTDSLTWHITVQRGRFVSSARVLAAARCLVSALVRARQRLQRTRREQEITPQRSRSVMIGGLGAGRVRSRAHATRNAVACRARTSGGQQRPRAPRALASDAHYPVRLHWARPVCCGRATATARFLSP